MYLPEAVYGRLTLRSVSGDLVIPEAFPFAETELLSTSGDIEGSFLSEKYFTVHTTSGEIQVSDSPSAAQECAVMNTSGDIRILTKGFRE